MPSYARIASSPEVDMQHWQKGDNETLGEVSSTAWSLVFCDEMWIRDSEGIRKNDDPQGRPPTAMVGVHLLYAQ
jgi:hypothetical protein